MENKEPASFRMNYTGKLLITKSMAHFHNSSIKQIPHYHSLPHSTFAYFHSGNRFAILFGIKKRAMCGLLFNECFRTNLDTNRVSGIFKETEQKLITVR